MSKHTILAGKGHSTGGYRKSHMHRVAKGAISVAVERNFKVVVAGKHIFYMQYQNHMSVAHT